MTPELLVTAGRVAVAVFGGLAGGAIVAFLGAVGAEVWRRHRQRQAWRAAHAETERAIGGDG